MEKFKTLQKENYLKKFNDNDLSILNEYYDKTVDPITAITILETGIKIIELFSSEDDNSSLKQEVDKILDELDLIKTSLANIVEILKELKILIERQFTDFVKFELVAAVNTSLQFFRLYSTNQTQDNTESIRNLLQNLIHKSNLAMQYGYTHYNTLLLALKVELLFIKALNLNDEFKNDTNKRYLDYLRKAVNHNVSGSLSQRGIALQNELRTLKEEYVPKQFQEETKEDWIEGRWDIPGTITYLHKLTVSGSIDFGFQFATESLVVRKQPGRMLFDREPGGGRFNKNIKIRQSQYFTGIINSYQNAHLNYTELLNSISLIESGIEIVEKAIMKINGF